MLDKLLIILKGFTQLCFGSQKFYFSRRKIRISLGWLIVPSQVIFKVKDYEGKGRDKDVAFPPRFGIMGPLSNLIGSFGGHCSHFITFNPLHNPCHHVHCHYVLLHLAPWLLMTVTFLSFSSPYDSNMCASNLHTQNGCIDTRHMLFSSHIWTVLS